MSWYDTVQRSELCFMRAAADPGPLETEFNHTIVLTGAEAQDYSYDKQFLQTWIWSVEYNSRLPLNPTAREVLMLHQFLARDQHDED